MGFSMTNKILAIIFISATLVAGGCSSGQKKTNVSLDKQKEYANELLNKQLYSQAVSEFETYLQNDGLDDETRANINYIIATTYLERLKDYQNALAYFLKIKTYYPSSKLDSEVNKGVVACLERLERSADAQQALSELTTMNPGETKTSLPGRVVAELGERKITQGDLDAEIKNLPPPLRQEYQAKAKKLQFLQQMLATDLMFEKAKRAGYENDKEIVNQLFQAKKSILVQKLIQDEIRSKINITDFDIKLYYDANKDQYKTKDDKGAERVPELAEVKDRVKQELQMQREQQAYQQLVGQLLTANNVKLYGDLVE